MTIIATAWCLSKKGVNPIIGLSSTDRIDSAVAAVKWVKDEGGLTEEEIKYLEEGYRPKVVAGY
jgi:aryl-alcohol dehydrogenase-like predicted oxidoreductase